jgi:hypothetical protein
VVTLLFDPPRHAPHPYLFNQVSNPPYIPLIVSLSLYTFLHVFSACLKYFIPSSLHRLLPCSFFPCSFSKQCPWFYLPLAMYCCTQFFHSNFLAPHIPTILYYTYDKHYVVWRNDVNKQQSFIVSQLTLCCNIRMRLSNISRKEHMQYFFVFWEWVVGDSILQLIWVNVVPIFIICI